MKGSLLALTGLAVAIGPLTADSPQLSLTGPASGAPTARLSFSSQEQETYDIQASADLQTWHTLHTGLSGGAAEKMVQELDVSAPRMFYRMVIRRPVSETTVKLTNTYTSGRQPGTLTLGPDPRPFNPDAEPFDPDAHGGLRGEFFGDGGGAGGGFGLEDGDFWLGEPAPAGGDEGRDLPGAPIIDPWPFPDPDTPQPGANLLTAAEWNDHEHWADFQSFLQEYPDHFDTWQLNHQQRLLLTFVDSNQAPLHDVEVTFVNACFDGLQRRTHNDGTLPLFIEPPMADCLSQETLALSIQVGGSLYQTDLAVTFDDDQAWTLEIPLQKSTQARRLDLAWVVDVTGSMGDELRFIREELIDIVAQIQESASIDDVRIATIFYRDRGDRFVTRVQDFSADLDQVQKDIEAQRASGGGDFPESVNAALFEAMRTLSWRQEDTVRLAFLVADAPPHYYPDEQYTYRDAIPDAQASAIKLFPVAGSGIDKSTEYLFRNLAVATLGKYIFITDDSGIGNPHLDPDIEQFEVETLNAILIRTILEAYHSGQPETQQAAE